MKKDAFWFTHDSNAKDDPKITLLIDQLGLEGFGIFWILVETLRDQPEYKYPLQLLPSLARKYATTFEKIKLVVFNYSLFEIENDTMFFSRSLNKRMIPLENTREQRRQAGVASAAKRKLIALQEAQNVEIELNKLNNEINERSTTVQQSCNIVYNSIKEESIKENNNNKEPENFAVAVVDSEPLKPYRKGIETDEQHKQDIRNGLHKERINKFLINYKVNNGFNLRNEIDIFVTDQGIFNEGRRHTIDQFLKHLISWLLRGNKIRLCTESERAEVLNQLKKQNESPT